MKKTMLTLAFSTLMVSVVNAVPAKTVPASVDHLFVPSGFDNNDNVEIIVTGKYPNPCYLKNTTKVEVAGDKVFIKIDSLKRSVEDSPLCAPLAVPFTENISVGNLQGGDYELVVNAGTKFEQREKLHVGMASSNGVDDHYYAMVEYIDLGITGGWGGHAQISAWSPSTCLVFDRAEYISNGRDTISVLPIMKKVSGDCEEKMVPFTFDVHFTPMDLNDGNILLYVRSMEGKSSNGLLRR